ncbi:hypothetical protein ACFCZ1_12420 [Streptomyces sp. NPDC056224]|uniref:hypothetical protein n=1 Tax=Streptomyces sp. NPDC056224 TaxID=3345750 RepID=UPI0035DE1776
MATQGPIFGFRTEDLTLDSDGQVRILDPQLARAVAAALAAQPDAEIRDAANNCHGGNCAKGCGSKLEEQ